jgi:hypothetical protein
MRTPMNRAVVWVVIGLVGGCGGPASVPAGGTVTLDGQPVAGAAVMFLPESEGGLPAGAETDAAGHFSAAVPNEAGVRPGRYKVTVSKIEPAGGPPKTRKTAGDEVVPADPRAAMAGAKSPGKHLLPAGYADARTTPLRAEVPPGGTTALKLELSGQGP